MDTRETLAGVAEALPKLPLEGVETLLVSFEMLVAMGDTDERPWAAERLRQAAALSTFSGVRERLLAAASAVAAGEACARTPERVTYPSEASPVVPNSEAADDREEVDVKPLPHGRGSAGVSRKTTQSAERPPRKPGKLAEFKTLNVRKASLATLGGFKPTFDPLATKFGFKPVARAAERWPEIDGRPMLFVCQLNLAAAPIVPKLLEDVKLMTFFLDFSGRGDGDGETDWRFELRTYESTEGLATLEPPVGAPSLRKGFECKWEAVDEYPCHEDPDAQNPRELDTSELELPNAEGTKIGGWPNLIQSELSWQAQDHPAKPEYCLQIASEEKAALAFGDSGTLYLARGTAPGCEGQWFLDWQSL